LVFFAREPGHHDDVDAELLHDLLGLGIRELLVVAEHQNIGVLPPHGIGEALCVADDHLVGNTEGFDPLLALLGGDGVPLLVMGVVREHDDELVAEDAGGAQQAHVRGVDAVEAARGEDGDGLAQDLWTGASFDGVSSSRPSFRPFLNELTARPHCFANSGILLGPKRISATTAMMMISVVPRPAIGASSEYDDILPLFPGNGLGTDKEALSEPRLY